MSVCVNDTDGDGDCPACARDPEAPCRVSARDAIHRLFESGRTSYRLDGYLDAYAHELAEGQRQFARDLPAAMGRDGLIRNLTFQEAADLIDPEVLNSAEGEAVRPA